MAGRRSVAGRGPALSRRNARFEVYGSLQVYHRATMADQLSLRLDADQLPDLPDLRPMIPRPFPEPFDSADHLFEPWWGGERALVFIGPAELPGTGAVRIVGRGRRRTALGHSPNWPGWPSAWLLARRSSTASSWSSIRPGGRTRPGSQAGSRDAPAVRRRSSPSTSSCWTGDLCCLSRSTAVARRCGRCFDRVTRSWPFPRSPPRASRCSRRP